MFCILFSDFILFNLKLIQNPWHSPFCVRSIHFIRFETFRCQFNSNNDIPDGIPSVNSSSMIAFLYPFRFKNGMTLLILNWLIAFNRTRFLQINLEFMYLYYKFYKIFFIAKIKIFTVVRYQKIPP